MHCKKLMSVLALGSMALLSACDRTVENSTNRLNIYPSLGLIQEAKVRVYAADGKTLLAKGSTGKTGLMGIYAGKGVEPAVIELEATNATVYYDEAQMAFVSLPAGTTMYALVSAPFGNFAVTPLTDMAYRIAVDKKLFPLSKSEVEILNERVRAAFAPELSDITLPPTILSAPLFPKVLSDIPEYRYAVRLIALAQLGSNNASSIVSVMQAMGVDVLDGVIDGLDKNSQPIATPYIVDPNSPDYIANALPNIFLQIAYPTPPEESVVDDAFATALSAVDYAPFSVNIDLTNIDDGSNFTGCQSASSALPVTIQDLSTNLKFERGDITSPYVKDEVVRAKKNSHTARLVFGPKRERA